MECSEKMLNIGIEVQNQCHVRVSMLLVQATAHSIYEYLSESDDNVQPFSASTGCFSRFTKRYNFHNIKMTGRLQWYGHVKRMPEERIPKLIMDWIPRKRRKRGRPRKMWMEGVQAAMTTRNLEPDQWRNREEWCLVSGRRQQLLKTR